MSIYPNCIIIDKYTLIIYFVSDKWTHFFDFIGLHTLEIFLMIKMGGKVGALSTIALIFLTAVIGVYFAKLQGIQTLKIRNG